ncbi:class I SAM-dependent methyltransferase [Candidatus Peregrinibacteria bacterium]|jgi:SAM-dependent methyltransferase|nr:class I SAM-dependent methyltransferase [Candidatus Peregrinibacteria bacterium]MBT7484661.1 class I SAM-dependent methyltransferase [Candidatus Peregrinibacteria bacterium]MBT7703213.1 class I SAM-dependent methyltransferase [Candidatus Peregrinibacteria bacterium]
MKRTHSNLSAEDFTTSSIIRFGGLDDYIEEKMMVDYFIIEGNLGISRGVRMYLLNQIRRLKEVKQIKILDAGCAIGALTSLLVMQELARAGLLHKTKLILLDVSERVIHKTQMRNFQFPSNLVNSLLKFKIYEKLRHSKGLVASCEDIPLKDNSIDISLAGFLFQHLHDKTKKKAAEELQRVTKPGGFIGVAESWFEDHSDYLKIHEHDEIPLAHEAPISYRRLRQNFKNTEIFEANSPIRRGTENEHFYYFCGMKKAA